MSRSSFCPPQPPPFLNKYGQQLELASGEWSIIFLQAFLIHTGLFTSIPNLPPGPVVSIYIQLSFNIVKPYPYVGYLFNFWEIAIEPHVANNGRLRHSQFRLPSNFMQQSSS
jgi:hypothetical protein